MKVISWLMKTEKLNFMLLFSGHEFSMKGAPWSHGPLIIQETHTTSSILWLMADKYQTKLSMRVMNF